VARPDVGACSRIAISEMEHIMKIFARATGMLVAVVTAVSFASPAGAATAQSESVDSGSNLIESGTFEVKSSAARSCLYASYTLSQVESDRVKISYLLKDGCRGHQVMTWAARTDRFSTSSAPGAVKHHEWTCYTCHQIKREVYMSDPNFGQTFQALTNYIGLTGSSATGQVEQGKQWTT
jgi:hypothetical protein